MDINTLRIVVTILAFCAFAAIVVWAYMPARRRSLEEQGESILEDNGRDRRP